MTQIIRPGVPQAGPTMLGVIALDIRDYLAAMSLTAAAQRVGDIELAVDSEWCLGVANVAYELADAMLKVKGDERAS